MDCGSVDNVSCIFIGFNNFFNVLKDIYLNKTLSYEKISSYLDFINCDKLIKSSNLYYDEKMKNNVKKNYESFNYEINYDINSENKIYYSAQKINPKQSSIICNSIKYSPFSLNICDVINLSDVFFFFLQFGSLKFHLNVVILFN